MAAADRAPLCQKQPSLLQGKQPRRTGADSGRRQLLGSVGPACREHWQAPSPLARDGACPWGLADGIERAGSGWDSARLVPRPVSLSRAGPILARRAMTWRPSMQGGDGVPRCGACAAGSGTRTHHVSRVHRFGFQQRELLATAPDAKLSTHPAPAPLAPGAPPVTWSVSPCAENRCIDKTHFRAERVVGQVRRQQRLSSCLHQRHARPTAASRCGVLPRPSAPVPAPALLHPGPMRCTAWPGQRGHGMAGGPAVAGRKPKPLRSPPPLISSCLPPPVPPGVPALVPNAGRLWRGERRGQDRGAGRGKDVCDEIAPQARYSRSEPHGHGLPGAKPACTPPALQAGEHAPRLPGR